MVFIKLLYIIVFILSLASITHASTSWKIDDLYTFTLSVNGLSGAVDADSVPSYRVYEDEIGTAILTGSMAKLDDTNTTGYYSKQLTLSAANGLEKGKSYSVIICAVISSNTYCTTEAFQIEAEVDSNVVSDKTGYTASTVSDKTGYSLAQSFPTNFASQSIDTSGRVLLQPTQTGVTIPTVTAVTNDVGITQAGADKAWGTAARVLTAGTNIALAKGTGVTGFNDLSAADVNTEVDTALSDYGALKPTIAGRTFDVTTTGEGGLDFTNVNGTLDGNFGAGSINSTVVADDFITAAKIAAGAIVKGTEITGFNDLSAAEVNAEVDTALNTAIPVSPTADSVNERIKAIDDKLPTNYIMGSAVITDKDDEIDAINNFVDTEITDIQSRLPVALVSGRMSSDMVALSGDTVASDALESAYDGTGYCEGCIAVTVSSGAATPASPAVLSVTGIITVDNQFVGWLLRCSNQERIIAATDENTADTIIVEPGHPFNPALGASASCYIK